MFTRLNRRHAHAALAFTALGLGAAFLPFQVGCGSNPSSYDNPAPAISAFTTGTLNGSGTFVPTPAGTAYELTSGQTAWFRANFGVYKGTAVLTPGNLAVTSNVPFSIPNVTDTTTYTLTVTAEDGQVATATATVNVIAAPSNLTFGNEDATYFAEVPIVTNTPTVSGTTPITFSVSPALPAGLSLSSTTGEITGTPQAASAQTTYTVTATNRVGSTTKDIKITVAATPLTFAANPANINLGNASVLSWDADAVAGVFSAVTISANPADATLTGPFALAGSKNVSPITTTTYTLSATPANGGAAVTRTVGVTVGSAPVAITSFTAAPTVTPYGGTSTLSWSYTGLADTLTLNGENVLGSSSRVVNPVRRQTYTLYGANTLGTDSESVTVAAQGLDAFAGQGVAFGYADGTGTQAKFTLATGLLGSYTHPSTNLTMDGAGNLYVADMANHVIRMVTPAGVVTTLAGKAGASGNTDGVTGVDARFNNPTHVLVWTQDGSNAANVLMVADCNNNTIRRLTRQGDGTWMVTLEAGTAGTYGGVTTQNLNSPTGLAKYNDKIFIADRRSNSIRIYDPAAAAGSRITRLSGGGTNTSFGFVDGDAATARFNAPSSLAIDPSNGDVYVADRENHVIRKVTQAGVASTVAGTNTAGFTDANGTAARFSRPTSIVRDAAGNFFISENGNHAIRKMDASLDVTTLAGTGSAGFAEGTGTSAVFNGPQGITLDAAGNLLVADSMNGHIRKLTASGSPATYTTSPFAGARWAGAVDATGIAASFNVPNGVAVDNDGNTYVADEANKLIRKISPEGAVTTIGTGFTWTTPYALSVDNALNVYVLERLSPNSAVRRISGTTGEVTTLALTGATLSSNCRGIAVNPEGTFFYVADGNNLRWFDVATNSQSAAITTGLSSVNGIAVANDGVYWVEFGSHTVKKVDLSLAGTPTVIAGGTQGFADGIGAAASFRQPVALALALDGSGNATTAYVVDQGNHALRKIVLSTGEVTTLVGVPDGGLAGRIGVVHGTLTSGGTAGLYFPKGIGITPAGDLMVSSSDGIVQITAP